VVFAVAAAAASAGAQEVLPREMPPPLDSLLNSDAVLARVGPAVVTVREFVMTSIFGPAFVKRQPETRQRMLGYMVNEKLLGLGMASHNNDPRVLSNLEALEGDFATEELFRDDVLSRVHVSGAEEVEGVRQQNTELSVRWLYRSTQQEAAALAKALREGASFDTLFAEELAAERLAKDDRQMTTTVLGLRQRNPAMAALAQQLAAGTPSAPVKAPDGFYIMQVDSVVKTVLLTETAEVQSRADVRKALTKMKADSLSELYVRRVMREADPVIQRPVFDLVRAYFGSRILSPERFKAFELTANLQRNDTGYANIDLHARRTLVAFRKGGVTVGDFLAWYRLREMNLTFRTSSPQAFFLSVEDVVWRMVRDRLLVKKALSRGLQRRPSVTTQMQWWCDKFLYQVAKDSIKKTIDWSDSTLQAYYNAHQRSFRDTTGAVRPFSAVRDDVLREWYDIELNARVLRKLNKLRQQFAVSVNEDLLKTIPVDAESDPRAIEVYAVKKGGTFPHPAFPTIDTFWQSWQ
jgi:hypothetical protein